jgi:DNA-binding NtrC family response regulator
MQILAVDGGDRMLAAQCARLREAGHSVTQRSTFETARQILLGDGCHIDLLITNLRLKAYNGLHLVSYTRAFCSNTVAIVVDGAADPINELEAHRFGAEYLASPVQSDQLQALVDAAETKHPLSDSQPPVLQLEHRRSIEPSPLETVETAYGIDTFLESSENACSRQARD